jgi:hypothetical protein
VTRRGTAHCASVLQRRRARRPLREQQRNAAMVDDRAFDLELRLSKVLIGEDVEPIGVVVLPLLA